MIVFRTFCRCFLVSCLSMASGRIARAQERPCASLVAEANKVDVPSAVCGQVLQLQKLISNAQSCEGADRWALSRIDLELRARWAAACQPQGASPATPKKAEPKKRRAAARQYESRPASMSNAEEGVAAERKEGKEGKEGKREKRELATTAVDQGQQAKSSIVVDVKALLDDARVHVLNMHKLFEATKKACPGAEPCANSGERDALTRELILAISVYLRIAVVWEPNLDRVREVIGVNPLGADTAAIAEAIQRSGHPPEALLAAVEILGVLDVKQNPERLAQLKARLKVLTNPAYTKLLDELNTSKPRPEKVREALRALKPEQLTEIGRVIGDVGRTIAAARALSERPMAVLMSPTGDGQCRGRDNALHALEGMLKGPGEAQSPIYVVAKDFENAVTWVRCRCHQESGCGEAPTPALGQVGTDPAKCQAILAVNGGEQDDGNVRITADLEIILPPGSQISGVALRSQEHRDFRDGCDPDAILEQERAAGGLFEWLAGRFDYLSGLPYIEPAARSVLVPSSSQDVHIRGAVADEQELRNLRGQGLAISGQCDGPEFSSELQLVLRTKENVIGRVLAETQVPDPSMPRLELVQDTQQKCTATLKRNGKVVLVLAGSVSAEPWKEAGAGIAHSLLRYYDADLLETSRGSRWGRAATSLLLSGLPQLSDGIPRNNRIGWILAGVDLTLLSVGVATIASSIERRNAYSASGNESHLDAANFRLEFGIGLLIGMGAERLLSGLGYGLGWLE